MNKKWVQNAKAYLYLVGDRIGKGKEDKIRKHVFNPITNLLEFFLAVDKVKIGSYINNFALSINIV